MTSSTAEPQVSFQKAIQEQLESDRSLTNQQLADRLQHYGKSKRVLSSTAGRVRRRMNIRREYRTV